MVLSWTQAPAGRRHPTPSPPAGPDTTPTTDIDKATTMTAPTTAPRTWTTAEILAEATDDIDTAWPDIDTTPAETWPILTSLCDVVNDIDHDGLDYAALRAERFTH